MSRKDQGLVSRDSWNELSKICEIQERQLIKLRSENRELKEKLELLKNFEFLRMLFK